MLWILAVGLIVWVTLHSGLSHVERLLSLVLTGVLFSTLFALSQAQQVERAINSTEAWTPTGVSLVLTAVGTIVGTILTGWAAVINAKGSKKASERAEAASVKTSDTAAEIKTMVDGGRKAQEEQIASLTRDLKDMRDQMVALTREHVQDIKEAAATAAAVAATVLPADGIKPVPVQVVGTLERRKDEMK